MADTGYTDRSLGVLSGDRAFQRIGHGLVWLTIAISGFVMFEPAPYDLLMLAAIVLFALIGLPLPRRAAPMLLLLFITVSGGFLSALVYSSFEATAKNMAVTAFLSLSAIFITSYIVQNPTRNFDRILRAYCVAAAITATGAVVGYFGLAGAAGDFLTLYGGRARGFFKDPNVLGPFLVAPTLFALHTLLHGRSRQALWAAPLMLMSSFAIFLSFSRGAWGHLIFSGLVYGYLAFVTAINIKDRFRLIFLAIIGLCLLVIAGIGALSIEKVNDLFVERASLTQEYDTGYLGRFGRQVLGMELMARSPLGIGAKQFSKIFPEAPHNVYLNMFVLSGWTGGLAYMLLIGSTLVIGFRQSLLQVPWQGVYLVCYATFVGMAFEGLLIDTDHWRHFYLLLGLVWGGAIAPGGVMNRKFIPPSGSRN